MKKQPERTEQTRKALMEAFWKLYCEKKIEKITVREIVTLAGFYRSTFYEYFRDIYDVLEQIEQQLLDDFEQTSARSRTFHSMEAVLENVLTFYEANGERIAVLLGPKGDPVFASRAMEKIKENLLMQRQLPKEDMEADLLFHMAASNMIAMLNYWEAHRDTVTLRQVFSTGAAIVSKGMAERFLPLNDKDKDNDKNRLKEDFNV